MALPALAGLAARSGARKAIVSGGRRVLGFAQQQFRTRRQPMPFGVRRRRGRGISSAELRGFRKVANLIKMFTAPGRRTIFKAPRRRRGRF